MQLWLEKLLHYSIDDFGANDLICILHFKESDIEKDRTEYMNVGLAYKVLLKRSVLRHNAVPTIFPSKIPRNEKMRKLKYEYTVKLDYQTLAKQKEIFKASSALDAVKENPVREKIGRKRAMKRKLPIAAEASVVNSKLAKTNDLFQAILRAIDSKENLSTYLGSGRISNVSDRNSIR